MINRFNNYTLTRPKLRKVFGWFLVVVGFFAIVTPLTPGGLLFFVGLEILGFRFVFTERVKRIFMRKEYTNQIIDAVEGPKEKIS